MIRVRTDDVLVHSEPMQGKEFEKWRKHHLWTLESPQFYHTAAILCSEIQQFPHAIEYIRDEIRGGNLYLDLHGWEHIDYTKLAYSQILEHLEKSFEFMEKEFRCLPIRWATPWGASSEAILEACAKFGLKWEGTSDPVIDQKLAYQIVMEQKSTKALHGKTIMVHWFERGLRLFRMVQVEKHGSWEAAAIANPEYFKES